MSAPVVKLGEETICPKCGNKGKLGTLVVYAKGWKYTYLAVLHPAVYGKKEKKRSVKRCAVRLLSKEPAKPREAAKTEAAKPEPEERIRQLEEENRKLREEVEQLRRRLAEAQAQAQVGERVRAALAYLLDGKIVSVGQRERQALYLAAVARPSTSAWPSWAKKLNVSVEELKTMIEEGKRLLDLLTRSEFIAVRPDAWAQVEQLMAGVRP